jgi:SAM-dependent methyltransferase
MLLVEHGCEECFYLVNSSSKQEEEIMNVVASLSMKRCPLCQSPETLALLQQPQVPVLSNICCRSRMETLHLRRGRIDLRACLSCGFLFNAAFEPEMVVYDSHYSNTQAYAPSFAHYLDQLVQMLVEEHAVRQRRVLEIGCGDGSFLERLVLRGDNQGWGFDPSYRGPSMRCDGRLQVQASPYNERCKVMTADVVICRHVLEHLAHPVAFLRQLRQGVQHTPQTRFFFETPNVEWILQTRAFWDIYYEHCNYFSPSSLALAFQQAGFKVKQIQRVFAGQYLWLEAEAHPSPRPIAFAVPADLKSQLQQFQYADHHLRQAWISTLERLTSQEAVAVLGAAGKGVTFTNLVDPDCTLIACVVDVNPHKQGMFLPGTGHPIVGYADVPAFGVTRAILLNPKYRQDALAQVATSGLQVQLLEEVSQEEENGTDVLD